MPRMRADLSFGPIAACEACWAPLEVVYDYPRLRSSLAREEIASRAPTMWRYRELLPLQREAFVGQNTGYTPLIPPPRLAKALGGPQVYLEKDLVNHPTLPFNDRGLA